MKSTWSRSDALLPFPLPSSHPTEINLEVLGTVSIQAYELSVIMITWPQQQQLNLLVQNYKRLLEKHLPPKLAAIAVLFHSGASTPHESSDRLPAGYSLESLSLLSIPALTLTLVQRDFGDV